MKGKIVNGTKTVTSNTVETENISDILVASVGDYLTKRKYVDELSKNIDIIKAYLGIDGFNIKYTSEENNLLSDLSRVIERIKDTVLEGKKLTHLIGSEVMNKGNAMYYYDAIKSTQIHAKDNLTDNEFWHLEELRDFFLKNHVRKVKNS